MKHILVDTLKTMFVLYCIVMLGLLFYRTPSVTDYSYIEVLKLNLNLVPFKTIMLYINILLNPANLFLLKVAVVNLIGNLVVFIPLGIFMLASFFGRGSRFFIVSIVLMFCFSGYERKLFLFLLK